MLLARKSSRHIAAPAFIDLPKWSHKQSIKTDVKFFFPQTSVLENHFAIQKNSIASMAIIVRSYHIKSWKNADNLIY